MNGPDPIAAIRTQTASSEWSGLAPVEAEGVLTGTLDELAGDDWDRGFELYAQHSSVPDPDRALELLAKYLDARVLVDDPLPGWTRAVQQITEKLARSHTAALQNAVPGLSGSGREQAEFALAVAGNGPWSATVMERVARMYLNAAPDQFPFEGRVPLEVLASFAEKVLAKGNYPILQWHRVEALWSIGSSALKGMLVVNYCGEDFRSRAMNACGDGLLEYLRFRLRAGDLSYEGTVAASLCITRSEGSQWSEEIPADVRAGLLLDLRCGSTTEGEISLAVCRQLPPHLAGMLIRECLREERAIALISVVDDEALLDDVLQRCSTQALDLKLVSAAVVECGARAMAPLLRAAEGKKISTALATVLCDSLGKLQFAEGAPVLVSLLGHTSAAVRNAAEFALQRLGGNVRPNLADGAKHQKKTIRDACARLLSRIDSGSVDVAPAVRRAQSCARSFGEAERLKVLAAFEHPDATEDHWQNIARPLVHAYGSACLIWLRDWLHDRWQSGETRLWCSTVEELREDADAIWVAVDTFARMPKVKTSYWARPRRAFSHCGPVLGAPVAHVLTNVATEFREVLYGLLAANAPGEHLDVFLAGLQDPSKSVRSHCVDGLSRLARAPVETVATLLSCGDIGTRSAATQLLAIWGDRSGFGAVKQAYEKERSRRVLPYLEDALVAMGRPDVVFGGAEGKDPSEDDVLAFLDNEASGLTLPRFLVGTRFQVVRTKSGRPLTQRQFNGLLARVMTLDVTLKGRLLRTVRARLDARDLRWFSHLLYSRWARARDTKHKWALLQLWLFADDDLLEECLWELNHLRSTEYLAAACHLTVCQWHLGEKALSWLSYWSHHSSSFGLRAHAHQLLQRAAFKEGLTVEKLRERLNPFIGDEVTEQRTVLRLAPGTRGAPYAQEALLQRLESAYLSGRTWTRDAWLGLVRALGEGPQPLFLTAAGQVVQWRVGLDPAVLPASSKLRLLHPLHLDERVLAALDATSLPTPFPQLKRRALRRSSLDVGTLRVSEEAFRAWRRRESWFHGEPMDAGMVYSNALHVLARDLIVTLHHTGYAIGQEEPFGDVSVLNMDFSTLGGAPVGVTDFSPIVESEVLLSVSKLGQETV